MDARAAKTRMIEREAQSPERREEVPPGREKQHTGLPHLPPASPLQKRTRG